MANSAEDLLAQILAHDKRYDREAYRFVSEALGFTVERAGRTGHVTGKELCEGMRDFALQSFGRLARTVLATWGLKRTEDVGEIVFNMVEAGLLRKTDEDRREDFRDVFTFEEAFDRGFVIHIDAEEPGDERRES